jgi:hypothetical protein
MPVRVPNALQSKAILQQLAQAFVRAQVDHQ